MRLKKSRRRCLKIWGTSRSPPVTGLRNKYAPYESVNEQLATVCLEVSKYAIKVASRTDEIRELWIFYGLLDELWEIIRHIFGSVVNNGMEKLKRECKRLLRQGMQKDKMPKDLHNKLLHFRSRIYQLKQVANFGFEVERSRGGIFGS